MKKISKKTLCLVLLFTILMAIFMPSMVHAINYDLNSGNVINSYDVTSDEVILYVGNISLNGISTIRYLYTDKSVNESTLTEIRKILTSDYASLLPTSEGQVAVSNDGSMTVNELFTDAGMIAVNKFPSGTVSDTSSTILYNEEQMNNLATQSALEVFDENVAESTNLSDWNNRKAEWDANEQAKVDSDSNYTPVEFPEEYVNAFKDSTTYPESQAFIADTLGNASIGYIIRNGTVAQVDTYPINRTIVKVVNTSANVDMPDSLTPITSADVTLEAPKAGDTVEETTVNYGYGDFTVQSLRPTVSTTTEGVEVAAYWCKGLEELSDESFYGTFEEGKDYYALIEFEAKEGYELTSTFPDGIKINGQAPDEVFAVYGGKFNMCVAKIKAVKEEVPPTEEEAEPEETETEETNTEETAKDNPKTGDNIGMWINLMIVSILGIAGTVKFINKRK